MSWAVDVAIITLVLPSAEGRAKDMGIANIANTLPQALAPVIAGAILGLSHSYTSLVRRCGGLRPAWHHRGDADQGGTITKEVDPVISMPTMGEEAGGQRGQSPALLPPHGRPLLVLDGVLPSSSSTERIGVNYKIRCRTFGAAPCRIFELLRLEICHLRQGTGEDVKNTITLPKRAVMRKSGELVDDMCQEN